jgi:hypothetical protein
MRFVVAGLLVLVLGFVTATPASAGHPLSFLRSKHCQDDCGSHDCGSQDCGSHPLSLRHKLLGCWHPLRSLGGHGLLGGHPLAHLKHPFAHLKSDPGPQPWFHTFTTCPGPDAAFPMHPYARSPRDFFMYEW